MVKRLKSGTSIKNHIPSRPSSTTNHGISNPLVRPRICRSITPTHNGGRSSSIKETNSSMSERKPRYLISGQLRMLKLNQLLSRRITVD